MSGTLLNALLGCLAPTRDSDIDVHRREEERFRLDRNSSTDWPPERPEPYDPRDKSRERELQILMSCWM